MSAQQTSYSLEQSSPSQPGMVSSTQDVRVRPFRNDNASPVDFGLAVCRSADTDDMGFDLCNATRQFLGVLTWGQIKENGTDGLASKEMGSIMESGEVYVRVVEDVTPESTVKVFIADHSGTIDDAVPGAFGDTAVSAKTATLANAKYAERASAGSVCRLRLNGPGPILLTADS